MIYRANYVERVTDALNRIDTGWQHVVVTYEKPRSSLLLRLHVRWLWLLDKLTGR